MTLWRIFRSIVEATLTSHLEEYFDIERSILGIVWCRLLGRIDIHLEADLELS